MKKKLVLLTYILLLAACQPSAADIQKAISQTQTALPTSTTIPTSTVIPSPTVISLKDINLSEIMFLPGDLPDGFEPSQVWPHGLVGGTAIEEGVINMFHQDVTYQGKGAGRISVYLYNNPEQASSAFELLATSLPFTTSTNTDERNRLKLTDITDLGDKAFSQFPYQYAFVVVFVRCNAVVAAETYQDYAGTINYEKRLDGRLSKLVCQ